MLYLRIISFLFLLFSTVFLPLPLTIVFFIFCSLFLPSFWEGVLIGVFLDALFSSPAVLASFELGFFTISFMLVVFVAERLKQFIEDSNVFPKFALGISGSALFYAVLFLFFN